VGIQRYHGNAAGISGIKRRGGGRLGKRGGRGVEGAAGSAEIRIADEDSE